MALIKSFATILSRSMRERYLVWTALGVPQGKVRLLLDAVQVFVKPVQQKGQQLLGVLLLVAGELGGKTSDLRLGREKKKIGLTFSL